MRNLNLDQVQTLVAIGDLGTFAAAARALHLSPPAVSLHVSELESRLGMRLLERTVRQVRPTAAGAALIVHGRRLLKDTDDLLEQMRRIAEGRAGKVRLGTSTGIVVHLLPRVLQSLSRREPDLEVELSILASADTMSRLEAGTLELGIVALPQMPRAGLVVTPWRSDPMMAFLPPTWSPPARVTPQWLASRPLIANDSSTLMHRLVGEWFAQAGERPRARIELNYSEAMKSLVAAGYGAAVLPLESPADQEMPTSLQLRPLRPRLVRRLGIAHRPTAQLDRATTKVLAAIREVSAVERLAGA